MLHDPTGRGVPNAEVTDRQTHPRGWFHQHRVRWKCVITIFHLRLNRRDATKPPILKFPMHRVRCIAQRTNPAVYRATRAAWTADASPRERCVRRIFVMRSCIQSWQNTWRSAHCWDPIKEPLKRLPPVGDRCRVVGMLCMYRAALAGWLWWIRF